MQSNKNMSLRLTELMKKPKMLVNHIHEQKLGLSCADEDGFVVIPSHADYVKLILLAIDDPTVQREFFKFLKKNMPDIISVGLPVSLIPTEQRSDLGHFIITHFNQQPALLGLLQDAENRKSMDICMQEISIKYYTTEEDINPLIKLTVTNPELWGQYESRKDKPQNEHPLLCARRSSQDVAGVFNILNADFLAEYLVAISKSSDSIFPPNIKKALYVAIQYSPHFAAMNRIADGNSKSDKKVNLVAAIHAMNAALAPQPIVAVAQVAPLPQAPVKVQLPKARDTANDKVEEQSPLAIPAPSPAPVSSSAIANTQRVPNKYFRESGFYVRSDLPEVFFKQPAVKEPTGALVMAQNILKQFPNTRNYDAVETAKMLKDIKDILVAHADKDTGITGEMEQWATLHLINQLINMFKAYNKGVDQAQIENLRSSLSSFFNALNNTARANTPNSQELPFIGKDLEQGEMISRIIGAFREALTRVNATAGMSDTQLRRMVTTFDLNDEAGRARFVTAAVSLFKVVAKQEPPSSLERLVEESASSLEATLKDLIKPSSPGLSRQ